MCTDGVSLVVLNDERIQQAMADPKLDFVHKQVLLTLYSMQAAGNLDEYEQMLPLYLSSDWAKCEGILGVLEQVRLISNHGPGIELTYKIEAPDVDDSCGCHAHA